MRVLNTDADAVIPHVEHKTGVIEKAMGLRFRTDGRAFFSFARPTRAAIDMLFVRTPLDIAFLDEDMQVMEIHGAFPVSLHPVTWRLYRPQDPYQYVLEVEQGLLQEKGFAEGDVLDVQE